MEEILTVEELANKLKVKPNTVYIWISKGCPVYTKSPTRLMMSQVRDWINSGR